MRADVKRNRHRILDAGGACSTSRRAPRSPRSPPRRAFRDRPFTATSPTARSPGGDWAVDADTSTPPPAKSNEARGGVPPDARPLGRDHPVSLEGIHVFDVVAPPCSRSNWSPRHSGSPTSLSRSMCRHRRLASAAGRGARTASGTHRSPLAIGPELDADGLAELREGLTTNPESRSFRLWLRGRATGALLTLGRPRRPPRRNRATGRSRDRPRRPLHRHVRAWSAPKAAEGGRRDPTEPAPASNLADHGRRGRGQRATELRGRR